jgi:hypothetical protein
MAPAIVDVTRMMLDKVQAGELGLAPAAETGGLVRNGWL